MSDAAKIGTYVLYGKTGVCLVKEQTSMAGGLYYVLSPVSDSRSSVYVPCGNAELIARMRPLLTREEIDGMLSDVDTVRLAWIDDRNERAMLYRTITGSGDRKELVRLLACLPTLCDTMNRSTPGLPVHHHLPEFTQTHVHRVSDAIPHLILCRPLLLLAPIPPSIRVFLNESALHIRWPKYWFHLQHQSFQ